LTTAFRSGLRALAAIGLILALCNLAAGYARVFREVDRSNEHRSAAEQAARLLERRVPRNEVVAVALPPGIQHIEFFYRLNLAAFPYRFALYSPSNPTRYLLLYEPGAEPAAPATAHTVLVTRRSLKLVELPSR
jgi:hypothetical protein